MINRWIVAALALALCGCAAKAQSRRHVTLAELPENTTNAGGVWESGPWTGRPWVAFGGGETLEIDHALGRRPAAVLVYLSFESSGTGAALAAGDLARIVEVTDAHVVVRNDTQADMFVRLALE